MKLALFAVSVWVVMVGCRTQPDAQEVAEVIHLSDTTLELGTFQGCNRDSEILRASPQARSAYFSESYLFAHGHLTDHRGVVVTGRESGRLFFGDYAEQLIKLMDQLRLPIGFGGCVPVDDPPWKPG